MLSLCQSWIIEEHPFFFLFFVILLKNGDARLSLAGKLLNWS